MGNQEEHEPPKGVCGGKVGELDERQDMTKRGMRRKAGELDVGQDMNRGVRHAVGTNRQTDRQTDRLTDRLSD